MTGSLLRSEYGQLMTAMNEGNKDGHGKLPFFEENLLLTTPNNGMKVWKRAA